LREPLPRHDFDHIAELNRPVEVKIAGGAANCARMLCSSRPHAKLLVSRHGICPRLVRGNVSAPFAKG
jgi:hypothetical protein